MEDIPKHAWHRKMSERDPDPSVHTFSRPPIIESLSLLPVAYRVGSYLSQERSMKKQPIFDLRGLTLQPPNPGPNAGVPLGGLGGGNINRGWRGEFRAWSLQANKYTYHTVSADVFVLRVKRRGKVYTKVLSCIKREDLEARSTLASWDYDLNISCGEYYALFPFAWSVFDEPVPGVRVIIEQYSPFLPNSYSESSLPTAVFNITVEDKLATSKDKDEMEVSIMFVFQNGVNSDEDKDEDSGPYKHQPFSVQHFHNQENTSNKSNIHGVFMPFEINRVRQETKKATKSNRRDTSNAYSNQINHDELLGDEDKSMHECGSFAIATEINDDEAADSDVTYCKQFVSKFSHFNGNNNSNSNNTNNAMNFSSYLTSCYTSMSYTNNHTQESISEQERSARVLYESFSRDGRIHDTNPGELPRFSKGMMYAGAICQTKKIHPGKHHTKMSFILAWDFPYAAFNHQSFQLPRYYTRFFGRSGHSAHAIAAYSLTQRAVWRERILHWQREVWSVLDDANDSLILNDSPETQTHNLAEERKFFYYHLFNECYYLTDGGTVWTDSSAGRANKPTTTRAIAVEINNMNAFMSTLTTLREQMLEHDCRCQTNSGKSDLLGQFLYLEGHEYYMYNTFDVHFYASFALLSLFPQLELSLQRDCLAMVAVEDLTTRRMMGEGNYAHRKLKNTVPHDAGSPCEIPWEQPNAYNFQDVSHWKDLGPKCVLQVLRDAQYLLRAPTRESHLSAVEFLTDAVSVVLEIMRNCEEQYDLDRDGMIENSGFPDQTYDIWGAKGVHAYCGGLWIAACEATAKICEILSDRGERMEFQPQREYYSALAERARKIYLRELWNGEYLLYDSSNRKTSDSIMADMLAGQWWSHVLQLDRPTVPRRVALSCLHTIFQYNVLQFGKGELLGAVNGMRPPNNPSNNWLPFSRSTPNVTPTNNHQQRPQLSLITPPSNKFSEIDSSCLQSREVWTGTTYALAACMMHEAFSLLQEKKQTKKIVQHNESEDNRFHFTVGGNNTTVYDQSDYAEPLMVAVAHNESQIHRKVEIAAAEEDEIEASRLLSMAYLTAKGIHDAGWQKFGYWFNTPEAWEVNGNYRSLGYMRPLSIWAMYFALEQFTTNKSSDDNSAL